MSQRDRAEKKAAEKAQRATVKAAKRARRRLDDGIVEDELRATDELRRAD